MYFMKVILTIFLMVTLIGCKHAYRADTVPSNVIMMPTDCANFAAIDQWLLEKSILSKGYTQSWEEYDYAKSVHKTALWNLRYTCNNVVSR
jgi:hypothetical protein